MSSLLFRLSLIGFVTALSARSVDPIIPHIAQSLAVQPATVALLSTAFAIPFALAQPILGPLADMVGKIRLMILCLVVLTLAMLASAFATDYTLLFILRVIAGMATGGIFPVGMAVVGDLFPLKERQVAMGRWLTVIMSGNLLGASVAGIINDLSDWRFVFLTIGGAGVAVFILAMFTLRHAAREHTPKFDFRSVPANFREILSNPRSKICYGAVFFEAVAIFGLFPFTALLLLASGESRASIAGLVIGGFSVGAIFYSLAISFMLRHWKLRTLIFAGGSIAALMLAAVALQLSWPIQFALYMIMGYGFFMVHGVIQVRVMELSEHARAAATSLHSFFFFLGQAAGPALFGLGLVTIGAPATLVCCAVLMLAVGLVCARKLG